MRGIRHLVALAATLLATGAFAEQYPIADLVSESLLASGRAPALSMPGSRADVRMQPGGAETAEAIDDFRYDPSTGRFTAIATGEDGRSTRVTGTARVVVSVPVPARRVGRGETLSEADLTDSEMPAAIIGPEVLTDLADIIGKEARRPLLSGRPVPSASLIEPRAVRKGEKVLISFTDGGLNLSAPGKAMEDGAIGDMVRVINANSNKAITVVVEAEGRVRPASSDPAP